MPNDTPHSVHEAASPPSWPKITVVGAGAVGGYFGGLLARAGAPVTLIGRHGFADAVNRHGLHVDTLTFNEAVRVKASTEIGAAVGSDIVLFCVKTTDTIETAKALSAFLRPGTLVVSLQNGVDNARTIASLTDARVIPSVVYLAASIPEPGHVKHTGRGDLVIGPDDKETRRLAGLFHRAGIPCRLSPHIEDDLWEKFICNCALNAISALCRRTYGEIGEHAETWSLVEAAIGEAFDIASASGITPTNMGDRASASEAVLKLTRQIAGAYSSTAQDLNRGKPTEIDALNGFIARRGLELGIPTPVNQTLHSLVKLAEGQFPGATKG